MRASLPLSVLSLSALFVLSAPAAHAVGDSDYDKGNETVTECPKGKVWDKKLKKCVTPKSGMIDDESLFEAGRALARAERYDEAIAVLGLAADRNDPRVLNYLGYANRKAGRIEVGLSYYHQALALDPDYVRAREYLGEAYLALGRVDDARVQLAEIEARCGRGCDEYADLAVEMMLNRAGR